MGIQLFCFCVICVILTEQLQGLQGQLSSDWLLPGTWHALRDVKSIETNEAQYRHETMIERYFDEEQVYRLSKHCH